MSTCQFSYACHEHVPPEICSAPQDLDYRDGALGIARTWPQGACVLPSSAAPFDWQGDRPLHLPMQDCVIYEAHMRGFTMHPSSKSKNSGVEHGQCSLAYVWSEV